MTLFPRVFPVNLYNVNGDWSYLVGVVCSLTGVTGSEGPEREDSWLTLLAVEGAGLARWSTKTPTTSPVRGLTVRERKVDNLK